MRRRERVDSLLFDMEIERTSQRNNSRRRKNKEVKDVTSIPNQSFISSSYQEGEDMAANPNGEGERQARRTLTVSLTVTGSLHFNNIVQSRVNATNMEIKYALIHLVQNNKFNSLSHENPYTHLSTFLEICNTVKIHQVYKVDESFYSSLLTKINISKINPIVNKKKCISIIYDEDRHWKLKTKLSSLCKCE